MLILLFYILNVTLLLLYEFQSGFTKQWKFSKLPGEITCLILSHMPVIIFPFLIIQYPQTRMIIAIITGVAGLLPFFIHKVIAVKKFKKNISNILIFGNMFLGILIIFLGIIVK